MKLINNILALAAMLMAAASCAIVSDDAFSTAPTAPVMASHADILITEATVDEAVTFAWEKARFIDAAEYEYALHVAYSGKDVILAEHITNLYYTLSKSNFRSFLMNSFDLPQNSTHAISVYTSITDDSGERYDAAALAVNVYVYDDAVPAAASVENSTIVLEAENSSMQIPVLAWSPARLVYGEDVTYTVVIKLGSADEYILASGIDGTSYSTSVDKLNDAMVAAGVKEGGSADVELAVYAVSESIPEGIVSNYVKVNVTTYLIVYPETLWMAGQGTPALNWNFENVPTLSLSAKEKGMYQGFIDLAPEDPGTDIQFKFSPVPGWNGDFSFDNVKVTTGDYTHVSASGTASANIGCPGGFYYIKVNKKQNTLEMVEIESFDLIGDFDGWTGTPMEWNAEEKTWTAGPVSVNNGSGLKFRITKDWKYSFGGTMEETVFGGGNITFTEETGSYYITFDASGADFYVKVTPAR